MKVIDKCLKYIKKPSKIIVLLNGYKIGRVFPDKFYLKCLYKVRIGKKLDLKNPKTFNEKLQWLKLYNRKEEYSLMVDKYAVKQYIADKIGEEYIIPTIGVWDNFDDIDFDKLPNKFVLKCTHDSGGLVICKDKSVFDVNYARSKIEHSLKNNYYWHGREWPYKKVKPRIIAEEFIADDNGELNDYKFMCFNGSVKCSFVCSQRYGDKGLHVTFFDKEWNVMPFERHYPHEKDGLPKPQHYKKMLELAEVLAAGMPFVRVDFYDLKDKIYFGELTFFPGGGTEEFTPEEWDYKLGEWIDLNCVETNK